MLPYVGNKGEKDWESLFMKNKASVSAMQWDCLRMVQTQRALMSHCGPFGPHPNISKDIIKDVKLRGIFLVGNLFPQRSASYQDLRRPLRVSPLD